MLTCLGHREQAVAFEDGQGAVEVVAQSKLTRSVIVEPAGTSTAN